VIDRLERAGYVRRVRDPHDRRKVLVEVTQQNAEKFAHLFEGALASVEDVLSGFTPAEIEVLERYNKASIDVFRARMSKG
jgi:DNA-binding MarR family transcriptional regulator